MRLRQGIKQSIRQAERDFYNKGNSGCIWKETLEIVSTQRGSVYWRMSSIINGANKPEELERSYDLLNHY